MDTLILLLAAGSSTCKSEQVARVLPSTCLGQWRPTRLTWPSMRWWGPNKRSSTNRWDNGLLGDKKNILWWTIHLQLETAIPCHIVLQAMYWLLNFLYNKLVLAIKPGIVLAYFHKVAVVYSKTKTSWQLWAGHKKWAYVKSLICTNIKCYRTYSIYSLSRL